MLGDKLAERLGVSIIVENNSQGAGAVAQQSVAKSAPDGYTMIMMTAGYPPQMALRKPQSFDPLDGFSFVTMARSHAARESGSRPHHLYDQRTWLDLSRVDQVDRA
jgi:tripartite-type tricarboxylate transporter receptor subunit TctC